MKNKIHVLSFLCMLVILSVLTLFSKDTISYTQRRRLKSFPDLSNNSQFLEDLDEYFNDHFFGGEYLVGIKSIFNNYIFRLLDDDGFYIEDNYIYELTPNINIRSIDNLSSIINQVQSKYFMDSKSLFVSIPNKNLYVHNGKRPGYSYDKLQLLLSSKINVPILDIHNLLSSSHFYRTDIHWKSETLFDVAKKICDELGVVYYPLVNYTASKYTPFYGGLYFRGANRVAADELIYLTSDYFDKIEINNLEKGNNRSVYDISALNSLDSYSVFLDGPSAYLEIYNPQSLNEDTLILFRDSYASSLLPLMIPSFKKIQVIDLRYYSFNLLGTLKFDINSKVLYLYGSEIINNSFSIK